MPVPRLPVERERLVLPEVTLPLAIEVPELVVEDTTVDGAFDYHVERLDLSLDARSQTVTIEPLAVASAVGICPFAGEGLSRGSGGAVRFGPPGAPTTAVSAPQ